MRSGYEEHFIACEHCRKWQRLHRTIDVSLIVLASVSAGVFLLAFGVIRHLGPRHAFWLELAALSGFALSALIWLIVAVATPAPDRKSTRLNSSHSQISYAVFCLKKKNNSTTSTR